MLDVGVQNQIFHGADYLGHAGLVVGAEQRGAVGHHEVLPHVVPEFGELVDGHVDGEHLVEGDVAAVVVEDEARTDAPAAEVGAGVDVGYEAYGRAGPGGVGRQSGRQVAVGRYADFGHADAAQFLGQDFDELHLLRGGWRQAGTLVALRVVGDVL